MERTVAQSECMQFDFLKQLADCQQRLRGAQHLVSKGAGVAQHLRAALGELQAENESLRAVNYW